MNEQKTVDEIMKELAESEAKSKALRDELKRIHSGTNVGAMKIVESKGGYEKKDDILSLRWNRRRFSEYHARNQGKKEIFETIVSVGDPATMLMVLQDLHYGTGILLKRYKSFVNHEAVVIAEGNWMGKFSKDYVE